MRQFDYEATRRFEDEVRHTAEVMWGLRSGECLPEFYKASGPLHELDGMARTPDVSHLLMVTTSRKLEKIKSDVVKLNRAEQIERRTSNAVSKWLITSEQLEAEHLAHARQNQVTVLTLQQFRGRYFNARDYLARRRDAPFGSARNLANDSVTIAANEYVPLPMAVGYEQDNLGRGREPQATPLAVIDIVRMVTQGGVVVVVAPFGSGKSLTLREVFNAMERACLGGGDAPVPVAINLRDHWGAKYPEEILDRHATSLGFTPKEHMTKAWRAGLVCLLIDGFDEVAAPVIASLDLKKFMRSARSTALEAVRELVSQTPRERGVLLCGRDHYFDDVAEMAHALGIGTKAFKLVRLGEFTEEQAARFLKKNGFDEGLPDWLPRKPLILGYLAHKGLLPEVLAIDSTRGFGHAWNEFLRLIASREAQYGSAVMAPESVRRVLENLAWVVRGTATGTGPITSQDLDGAYRTETGQAPTEGVLMQLQRLPGLTSREQDPSARSFIDEDLLAALQGSWLSRMVLEGRKPKAYEKVVVPLSQKAASMTAHLLQEAGASVRVLLSQIQSLSRGATDPDTAGQTSADLVAVAIEMARDEGSLDLEGAVVRSAVVEKIDLDEMAMRNVTFEDCTVQELLVGDGARESNIQLRGCIVARVNGVTDRGALAEEFVSADCELVSFGEPQTNASIVRSALPPGAKALLTVLRKLFLQAGGGRKAGALRRGVPANVSVLITDVVALLRSHGLVTEGASVVHPVRRQSARVRSILAGPEVSTDPIMVEARALSRQ